MPDFSETAERVKEQMKAKAVSEGSMNPDVLYEDRKLKQKAEDEKRKAEERATRESEERRQKEESDRKKQEKELRDEAERKEKIRLKIERDAESARIRQEEKDKLAELREDERRRKIAEKASASDESILKSTKTSSAERIAARNRIDERNREDAARIERANRAITSGKSSAAEEKKYQETKGQRKQITPDTIKDAIRGAASKAPAALLHTTTRVFGGISDSLVKQPTAQQVNRQYRDEAKMMSKAMKPHTKNPVISGAKSVPYLKAGQVAVSPGYVDALLGSGGAVRSHGRKKPMVGDLDRFVKKLF